MKARALVVVLSLAVFAFFLLSGSPPASNLIAQAADPGIDAMLIDMDPSGTPANTIISGITAPFGVVGSIETCARINENGVQDADEDAVDRLLIDITAMGIGPSDPMISFGATLNFPDTLVKVASVDVTNQLLSAYSGSSAGNASQMVPDMVSPYNIAGFDTSTDSFESGDGPLARVGIESVTASPGVGQLTIQPNSAGILGVDVYMAATLGSAFVAVNSGCPKAPLAVDTDPANTPPNASAIVGSVESCLTIVNDDVLNYDEDSIDKAEVDVIVSDDLGGIPAYDDNGTPDPADDSGGLLSFGYGLRFDASDVQIAAASPPMLLSSASGSNVIVADNGGTNPAQSFPNASGVSSPAAADIGPVPGSLESGAGVLTRFTVEAVHPPSIPSGSPLRLANIGLLDVSNSLLSLSEWGGDPGYVVNQPGACSVDSDGDQGPDLADNCISVRNPLQDDSDDDSYGDACDNCPITSNPGQENNDGDLLGDVCDPDDDNDSVADVGDNCPLTSNPSQANNDGDPDGDACDADDDNDAVPDEVDNCPLIANPGQENGDVDPVGDACDNCPVTDNPLQENSDSDPIGDACDNCPITTNPSQADLDGDLMGDLCDPDDDNDSYSDTAETTCGSNPLNDLSTFERIDGAFAGVDDDGDTLIDELLPSSASAFDCDGDGYTGAAEDHIYAPNLQGDQDPCGTAPDVAPFNTPVGWPADLKGGGLPFESTNKVDIVDVNSFLAPVRYINTNIGDLPGNQRWDFVPGSGIFEYDINIQDLTNLLVLYPQMLGGEKALGGPPCPWAP